MPRPRRSAPAKDDPAVQAFAARLATTREFFGFRTAVEFARFLNVEPETYRSWERGINECPLRVIAQIRNKFDVSLDWLIAGKGAGFAANREQPPQPPVALIRRK